jgi:hypothetical protein
MSDIIERLRSAEVFIMTGGMVSLVAEEAATEIEKLRAALKEFNAAYEDWFSFVEGKKDDPNKETKACYRLIAAQKEATSLTEREQTNDRR